jgi:2,3-bisphosphoglycerate-independent phosphoglycerate mutase
MTYSLSSLNKKIKTSFMLNSNNCSPIVLMILDGWGYCKENKHNAIAAAHTPQWDEWWEKRPHLLLEASGSAVGLPDKQMGNSEVGHMHIGAGRVIFQDFTRINDAIEQGDFASNPVFIDAINALKATNKTLHVMGLLSTGGVHSHETHLFAFLKLCAQLKFSNVCLHLFLDGRDTAPQSALESIARLEEQLKLYPVARICSMSGRYYAMDRDTRWQRIEPVYRLMAEGLSDYLFQTPTAAIHAFYQQAIFDEFIPPTQIGEPKPITDDDCIFFFNFRQDRARELTAAFITPDFNGFVRKRTPKLARFISMTSYGIHLPTDNAFPPLVLKNTLGELLETNGLRQLRIAETEKYAHVTFFLNGGSEQVFAHEHRILIPSPSVATYDLQPEMSAKQLTDQLIKAIEDHAYDVIICNYANADMLGHTGNFSATVRAIECLDQAMHNVWEAIKQQGGQLLITADHGNAEIMFNEKTQQALTSHTNELVPFLYVGDNYQLCASKGSLIDVAPTILRLLKINQPQEMTGTSLLEPCA